MFGSVRHAALAFLVMASFPASGGAATIGLFQLKWPDSSAVASGHIYDDRIVFRDSRHKEYYDYYEHRDGSTTRYLYEEEVFSVRGWVAYGYDRVNITYNYKNTYYFPYPDFDYDEHYGTTVTIKDKKIHVFEDYGWDWDESSHSIYGNFSIRRLDGQYPVLVSNPVPPSVLMLVTAIGLLAAVRNRRLPWPRWPGNGWRGRWGAKSA
jgi:hypothetical protein